MIRWIEHTARFCEEDEHPVPVRYDMMLGDHLVGTCKAVRAWGDVGWFGEVTLPIGGPHATTCPVKKDLEEVKAWVESGVVHWVEDAFTELREEGRL